MCRVWTEIDNSAFAVTWKIIRVHFDNRVWTLAINCCRIYRHGWLTTFPWSPAKVLQGSMKATADSMLSSSISDTYLI